MEVVSIMKRFRRLATMLTVFAFAATAFLGAAPKMEAAAKADSNQIVPPADIGSRGNYYFDDELSISGVRKKDLVVRKNEKYSKDIDADIVLGGNTESASFYIAGFATMPKNVKNVTPDAGSIRLVRFRDYYAIKYTFKKMKNAKVTCTVKKGSKIYDVTYTFKTKKASKENAASQIKVGNTSFKKLNKSIRYAGSTLNGKIKVKAAKGWSLVSICKRPLFGNNDKLVYFNNNSHIRVSGNEELWVGFMNQKTEKMFWYVYRAL